MEAATSKMTDNFLASRGDVIVAITSLIEATADKDESVRFAVVTSLRKLANLRPRDVLENIVAFRKRNLKLSSSHLSALLQTMVHICEEKESVLGEDTVLLLIEFSINEMTLNRDYLPDLQMPASNVLVALGKKHCVEVMKGLLKHFQPGVLPHYAILHTMGALASANVFGIVPFVKATLGAMLPMLGMLRSEAMKQVFAFTVGSFSEAVLEYLVNIDQAPDRSVNKEAYETEISIAYDVLAGSWINTKDPKVLETVLVALGSTFSLLPAARIGEQAPRLVPSLLGLYRRGAEPLPVTRCLAVALPPALEVNAVALLPSLDGLLTHLLDQLAWFQQLCVSPDYAQPMTVKNHNEALRCFDIIATHFGDRVVEVLATQLRSSSERDRVRAIVVSTQLVNAGGAALRPRVARLVIALGGALNDNSPSVRRALLKAVVALACHGHLDSADGDAFVAFVVRGCRDCDDDEVGPLCGETLQLLATAVPSFGTALWPRLRAAFLDVANASAAAALARCLALLAAARLDNPSVDVVDDAKMGLPVFCRCLALLGDPAAGGVGVHVLSLLGAFAPAVSALLRPLWAERIPRLVSVLKDCGGKEWSSRAWEDTLLDFVAASVREIGEEQWTLSLGSELSRQTAASAGRPAEHNSLLRCLALVASLVRDPAFVRRSLDLVMASVRYHTPVDSHGCARAVGLISRGHLDAALLTLEHAARDELHRKSSRMLGLMKDPRQEAETERARLTLLTAHAEVAAEAPHAILLPHAENMSAFVTQQLLVAKDIPVKEAALTALGNIADVFHPARNEQKSVLQGRSQSLSLVLSQMTQPALVPAALRVAIKLVTLPPSLSSDERTAFARTCFDHVFAPPNAAPDALRALKAALKQILSVDGSPATLDELFSLLLPWTRSSEAGQRLAATIAVRALLKCYHENLTFGIENPSKFGQSGAMTGALAARCTDGCVAVRGCAVDAVGLALALAVRFEGHEFDAAAELAAIRTDIAVDDPAQLYLSTARLAMVICSKLPSSQHVQFAETLLDGLLDAQTTASAGASVVLKVFMEQRGGELYHHVDSIISGLVTHMPDVSCVQTRTGSARAVLALAKHHPKAVISALLRQPLPYNSCVSECWVALAGDSALAEEVTENFLRLVSSAPLYEDQKDRDRLRIAVLNPLAATASLQELFHCASARDVAAARFAELFAALLVVLACFVGASPPIHTPQGTGSRASFVPNRNAYKINPARVAVDAFKSFLLCVGCDSAAEALLVCSHMEVGESLASFVEMVPHLARAVCECMPQSLSKLVVCLNHYGTSVYDPQRIAVAACLAELVSIQRADEPALLESIVGSLLNRLTDPAPTVRRLCLKGLAGISQLPAEQRLRHEQAVMAALAAGLDDQDLTSSDDIPLEAMRGFSRMLPAVSQAQAQDAQVSVCLRIRPYLEKSSAESRAAAFRTLGDLARWGGSAPFAEQARNSLLAALLHLDDCDPNVVKACKYALRQMSPLLSANKLSAMMQTHLIDDAQLQYADFIADTVKTLVEELPDLVPLLVMHALSYIKSSDSNTRGNSAMFIGLLCGCVSADANIEVPLSTVCARLLHLLQDHDKGVRARAAEATARIFTRA